VPNLIEAFTAAIERSKALTSRPDNTVLLRLYGLFKQGTEGDNATPKPGFSDMRGRTKWTSWTECKGLSKEDAMQRYIDLVASLE
jgi:diazepam-binding inhibitor (GABA receptor modulator, acyl-CoA-binding protein)